MSTNKLDIFKTLKHIDNMDIHFFSSLTDDEKKAFHPIVVTRWLSGQTSGDSIKYINHILNPLVFSLYTHPELLYKLMVAGSLGTNTRYKWLSKKSKGSGKKTSVTIIKKYYKCSYNTASEYLRQLNVNDIIEMADALGEDNDIIKKIKSEFK